MSRKMLMLVGLVLWSWSGLGHPLASGAGAPASCDAAAASAERSHGLPVGILAAIGRVESGRPDAAGHLTTWPWTIDSSGAGEFLPSAAAAIAAVEALRQQGVRNIDVGCFQVNLEQHPDAFATLDAAFDPQVNADYAAGFLSSLYGRTGNWDDAVASYHSASPALGIPYRSQVFAQWASSAAPADPHAGGAVVIAGVRIWTPAAAGAAPKSIRIDTPQSASTTGDNPSP
jgi:hypothetical protein